MSDIDTSRIDRICEIVGGNPEWGISAERMKAVICAEAAKVDDLPGSERVFLLGLRSKVRGNINDKFWAFRREGGSVFVNVCDEYTWTRVRGMGRA